MDVFISGLISISEKLKRERNHFMGEQPQHTEKRKDTF
jgi:hypothetical protein